MDTLSCFMLEWETLYLNIYICMYIYNYHIIYHFCEFRTYKSSRTLDINEFSQAYIVFVCWLEGYKQLGLALFSPALWVWNISPLFWAHVSQNDKNPVKPGGTTSSQVHRTTLAHQRQKGIGLVHSAVAQLLCSSFSFGRTSFLQKDYCLWRRRLSCVKASIKQPV